MRAYEQVRVDICSHNLDVTLIGVGGGFAYGTLGNTHYGIEDINVMR
jgi:transketolase